MRDNLARAYQETGRLAEAVALFERTLADRERILGANHPDTLTSRNNLAHAYQETGRLAEAVALLERTLADRERILGADHPDTLGSRNNLAHAYQETGRLAEAVALFERTLADSERILRRRPPTNADLAEQPGIRLSGDGPAGRGGGLVRAYPRRPRAGTKR